MAPRNISQNLSRHSSLNSNRFNGVFYRLSIISSRPQSVMDELWFSLESLRSLLNFEIVGKLEWRMHGAAFLCHLWYDYSLFLCRSIDTVIRNGCAKVLDSHAYRDSCGIQVNGWDSRKVGPTIFVQSDFEGHENFSYSSSTSLSTREGRRKRWKGFSGSFWNIISNSQRRAVVERTRNMWRRRDELQRVRGWV